MICDATPDGVTVLPLEPSASITALVRAVERYGSHIGPPSDPPSPPAREHRPGAKGKTWPKPRRTRP